MSTALVQIIGHQPLPNIFDILALRPQRIISLHTQETLQVAERIRKFAAKLLPDCEHILCENTAILGNQINRAAQDGLQIIGNLTGGYKLQSFFTQVQLRGKHPAFYIDQTGKKFIDANCVKNHPLIEQLKASDIEELKASVNSLDLLGLFDDDIDSERFTSQRRLQLKQLAEFLNQHEVLGKAFSELSTQSPIDKQQLEQFYALYNSFEPPASYGQAGELIKDCNLAVVAEELEIDYPGGELLFDVAKIDIIVRHKGQFYAVAVEDISKGRRRTVPNLLKFSSQVKKIEGLGAQAIYYSGSEHIRIEIWQLAKSKNIVLMKPSLTPGVRKKVLVQTIGFEVHPNLFDVLRLQPDVIVHLVSPQSSEQSSNLFHALKNHTKGKFHQIEFADTGDIAAFDRLIYSELGKYSRPYFECHINLSGGTKALSSRLLFYAISKNHNILGIQTDSSYYTFKDIDPGFAASDQLQSDWLQQHLTQAPEIPAQELLKILLNAHGVRVLEAQEGIDEAEIYAHPQFQSFKKQLDKLLFANKAGYNREIAMEDVIRLPQASELMELLVQRGIFQAIEDSPLSFKLAQKQNAQKISNILVGGGHWEYQVQQALANTKQLNNRSIIKDSVIANLCWGTKDKSAKMEEDLLALDSHYNLVNISCKTSLRTIDILNEHIMEHASRCKQLGGKGALGAIACQKLHYFSKEDLLEASEFAKSFGVMLLKVKHDPYGSYLEEFDASKMSSNPTFKGK